MMVDINRWKMALDNKDINSNQDAPNRFGACYLPRLLASRSITRLVRDVSRTHDGFHCPG